jgi:hypothetical protein
VVNARGIEGTRVLQGLLALTKKHSCEALENACEIALSHGCWRLRTVRQLLGKTTDKQEPLPFLEEHPLIRPLADYGAVVAQAIRRQDSRSSVSEGLERHDSGVREIDEKSPDRNDDQSFHAFSTRPRSGYPSSGCSSAEPDSVLPDSSTVVPDVSSSTSEESSDE